MTKKFTQDLIAYEEEKKMPYVTSAERIGIEKGRHEGRDENMVFNAREMLLDALDAKFNENNVPKDIKQQIQALNNRIMLKRLHKTAIQSKDIEDFRQSMKNLASETESVE